MPQYSRRKLLRTSGMAAGAGVVGLAGCLGDDDDDTDDDVDDDDTVDPDDDDDDDEATTLGLNFTVPVENVSSLWGIDALTDELPNYGDDYVLEVTNDASTPDSIGQLAAGETDIVLVSTLSYASAVMQDAVPGGITGIAMDFWDAHPDHYAFTIYAGPDTGIEEPEDLAGHTIGVNATGTGTHAIIRAGLEDAGLTEDDVDIVEQDFPTLTPALEDGALDSGIYPAFFAPAARENEFTPVFDSADLWEEPYPFAFIVAANASLDEHEDEIRAWAEDYEFLLEYIYDNRDDVIPDIAAHFDLEEEQLDWYLTEHDFFREEPTFDLDALQGVMDDMVDLGFMDESFDVEEYATNEYFE